MLFASLRKWISIAVVAAFTVSPMAAQPAAAQTAAPSTLSGTVRSGDGAPVAAAAVRLVGVKTMATKSDASGAFSFSGVAPGDYELVVSKSGFQTYVNNSIVILQGQANTAEVVLAPVSFTSLRTIANVSSNAPGVAHINTSTASVNTISNQTFITQGQTQVTKILNETPGIISGASPENGNGASQGSFQNIQIRGALPYETEQLIDGHPTALSLGGTFDPIYLNPLLLQSVEVVKGPGSMPTEINYAIGGTVNYITLEPTLKPQAELVLGTDNWGGITTAFHATGSTPSHAIQYALGFATNGAPGPLRNYPIAGSQLYLVAGAPPWTINGQQIAQYPQAVGLYPPSANYAGIGGIQFTDPLYVCCWGLNTAFYSRGELAKIRANFNPTTSFTLSYLGGQAFNDEGGMDLTSLAPIGTTGGSFSIFSPPPGYNGKIPAGTQIPFDLQAFLPQFQRVQQNLYQGEFRTSFGGISLLARYFTAADQDYDYLPTAADGSLSWSGATYGGVLLCPPGATSYPISGTCSSGSPTMTYFNGQNATFKTTQAINQGTEQDHLRGESVQLEHLFDNGDDVAVSVDRAHHDSTSFSEIQTVGPGFYTLPPGASQTFMTEMARAHVFLTHQVLVGLADYLTQYQSHFTDDGGTTWKDATRTYNSPRLGVTWRPSADTAWRFSLGSSIAPPQLGLLSSQGTTPLPNINGAPTYYVQNQNNGGIGPETAWGIDLGVDHRFERSASFSVDLYRENLRNEFLNTTTLAGTYKGLPLYATKTANLGYARYEGIEASVQNAPVQGWGFLVQGDLQRAYAYNLPQYFYCSVPGPACTQDTNLGIISGANFAAGGLGFNTLNGTAVPYAMGYAEINHRTAYGTYALLGTTYYGNNNTFSRPPFLVFNGSFGEPINKTMDVQLSIDNILDTYGNSWTNYFGGIPTPLVNGMLGPTVAGNYGPTTFRLQFISRFGQQ